MIIEGYSPLNRDEVQVDSKQDKTPDLVATNDVAVLRIQIHELEVKQEKLTARLAGMDELDAQTPVKNEITRIAEEKLKLSEELAIQVARPSAYPPAPGPSWLEFVDSGWFGAVCTAVGVLNIACMAFANELQAYSSILVVLDQLFLVWYILELSAKWTYHRCNLFFGNCYVVWWNWVDAAIVIGGIVDQWVLAVVQSVTPFQITTTSGVFGALRFLRMFRILRFLKVVKALVQSDMSWTEALPFQLFMSGVIAVNSITMALELDVEWAGWHWFEQAFLFTYSFELAVRLKILGCRFFVNSEKFWNCLDFIMVSAGVFDLWLVPTWSWMEVELFGESGVPNESVANALNIVRILRILRVLRLTRLLRVVKPLYNLLRGIGDALASMQWVMVLTLLVLYGGAIIFTSLIGRGYIYSDAADIPPEASTFFGSVSSSFFSLFKLMNGDTSVVDPITHDPKGQLLFACFMILSNWAVLAILTSVVSEQMITSSRKLEEEDKQRDEEERLNSRRTRLTNLFKLVDSDGSGAVGPAEWESMLSDPKRKHELRQASNLDERTLRDVFNCLSEETAEGMDVLHYESFIAYLDHDKDMADRRQVLHLSHLMKELEKATLHKMDKLDGHLHERTERLEDHFQSRFEVLQDMLGKIMFQVNQNNHQERPSDDNDSKNNLGRTVSSEPMTEDNFSVLSDQEGVRVPHDLGRMTPSNVHTYMPRTLEVSEDTFEKAMLVQKKPRQEDPAASTELEKITLGGIGKPEDMTQSKLKVLEGMLGQVINAVNKPHHEDPPASVALESTTLSRIEKLEDSTQSKLQVLEGMLGQVMCAVSQISHQGDPFRPGECQDVFLSST